jgi:hypothetical protein
MSDMKKTKIVKQKKITRSVSKPKVAVFETSKDLKDSVLIVSLIGNLFVLSVWIVLNTTSYYDAVLFNFFVNR